MIKFIIIDDLLQNVIFAGEIESNEKMKACLRLVSRHNPNKHISLWVYYSSALSIKDKAAVEERA